MVRPMKGDHTEVGGEWQGRTGEGGGGGGGELDINADMMDLKKERKEEEMMRHSEWEPQGWVWRKLRDPYQQ